MYAFAPILNPFVSATDWMETANRIFIQYIPASSVVTGTSRYFSNTKPNVVNRGGAHGAVSPLLSGHNIG